MQGFKSAILAIFHFWQNGTFDPLHEIQIFFAKSILLNHYEIELFQNQLARFQKLFLFWNFISSKHTWNTSEVTPGLLAIQIQI